MLIIFDLDGTLVDSSQGIQESLESAIATVFAGVQVPPLNIKIGPPLRTMILNAFGEIQIDITEGTVEAIIQHFRQIYDTTNWKLHSSYPYLTSTLQVLHSSGHTLAVATNKPGTITGKILQQLEIRHFFSEVYSPDTFDPPFLSKADMVKRLIGEYQDHESQWVLVGDSAEDYAAAEANDLFFVAADYGYGDLAGFANIKYKVRQLDELPAIIRDIKSDRRIQMVNRDIFEDLFVLELANNHWGDLQRGLRIVHEFSTVVRYNNVRAAIKLQFRDVDNFIHLNYRDRTDIRYIKKTLDTQLTREELSQLVEAVRRSGCVKMVTPFDEKSVDLCVELGVEIIKVASSDITDWPLLEKIAWTRKPVMVSTGGSSLKDIDDMVTFFDNRNIPLAINHCVSIYPSEDAELQLNQIDFLKRRYPGHVIGLSTHEYHDWQSSIMIAYAKGARTFERHIDIETEDRPFSPYCSRPEQIAEWFQAFHKSREMCGAPGTEKIPSSQKEIDYLTTLVRGVYAKSDLPIGHILTKDDYYLAIPLLKGQLSCRELLNDQRTAVAVKAHAPLMVDSVDSLYNHDKKLREKLQRRGL